MSNVQIFFKDFIKRFVSDQSGYLNSKENISWFNVFGWNSQVIQSAVKTINDRFWLIAFLIYEHLDRDAFHSSKCIPKCPDWWRASRRLPRRSHSTCRCHPTSLPSPTNSLLQNPHWVYPFCCKSFFWPDWALPPIYFKQSIELVVSKMHCIKTIITQQVLDRFRS